jgi:hypothetical protein
MGSTKWWSLAARSLVAPHNDAEMVALAEFWATCADEVRRRMPEYVESEDHFWRAVEDGSEPMYFGDPGNEAEYVELVRRCRLALEEAKKK